jgi:hypothetical protein
MTNRFALGTSLAAALLLCSALPAADALKSGPQVGSKKLDVFHPLHATGLDAGTRSCLV